MAYSPAAIQVVYPIVEKHFRSARRSGVYAYKSGYHNSRANLLSRLTWRFNYSIRASLDKLGDADAASAIDISFNQAEMITVTKRLVLACARRDKRLVGKMREFFGTIDGKRVTGRNIDANRATSADSSHLWHLHVSGRRKFANDAKVWLGFAEVICGLPVGTLTGGAGTSPTLPTERIVYLDRLKPGVTDSDSVRWLQYALTKLPGDQNAVKIDGDYGIGTEDSVRLWQKANGDRVVDGDIGPLGFDALIRKVGLTLKVEANA